MENIFSFVGTSLRKRKRRRQSRVEKANFDFCDPGCSVNIEHQAGAAWQRQGGRDPDPHPPHRHHLRTHHVVRGPLFIPSIIYYVYCLMHNFITISNKNLNKYIYSFLLLALRFYPL